MTELVKRPGCIVLKQEKNTDNCESVKCRFVQECIWVEGNLKLRNSGENSIGKMEGGVPVNR
jgi:hypothetical protein